MEAEAEAVRAETEPMEEVAMAREDTKVVLMAEVGMAAVVVVMAMAVVATS